MIPRRTLLSLFGGAALALGAGTLAGAAEVTLRLHQFLPAQANVPTKILDVWADKVEADSGGRIEVQRFPSMQLGGKPPELVDQMIDGVVDIIWTLPGYTPGRFPRGEVFELPFIMTNAAATSRAYWRLYEEMGGDDMAAFKPIGLWVHGPGLVHSKKPVTQFEDLQGLKMRAPTRITTKLFSSVGANALGMPLPAVPEALSKGVIEATAIPWEVTAALKISELTGHHLEFGETPFYTATFLMGMNQRSYDRLPDELKAVIDANSGLDFSGQAGQVMTETDGPSRQIAVDLGNTITTITPEEAEKWRAASEPVIAEWIAEMDARGIDGQALYDRAKALIAEETAAQQ